MASQGSSPLRTHNFCKANHGTVGLAFTWILLTCDIIVVNSRLYARLCPRHNMGWDDYTAAASLIISIITGGLFTKAVTSGMGRHITCLSPESIVSMRKFGVISEALSIIGIGVVKISVCLMLLRVLDGGRRRISHLLWCLLVFVAVTHFAMAMLIFLHCQPLSMLWNLQVHGSCLSTQTMAIIGYIGFAIDGITDLICAAIPILIIQRLEMNVQTKTVLCILIGLGVFTAGCAIAKAITLQGLHADDDTWDLNTLAIWAAVEQYLGVAIASIPALRPLFPSFHQTSPSWSVTLPTTTKPPIPRYNNPTPPPPPQNTEPTTQNLHLSAPAPPLRGSENSRKKLLAWYKEAETLKNDKYLSQSTAEYHDDNIQSPRSRTTTDEETGTNYLAEWLLPDIADRSSAFIALPLDGV